MGEKVKPKASMDFTLIGKGIQFFIIESTDIEKVEQDDENKKNDKSFTVQSRVQGGEDDGVSYKLQFPHISKGHFGLARAFGFMQKCGVMTDKAELDVEFFDSKEFETGWRMKMPKRTWAGMIKHVPGTKKAEDGSTATFANVTDFYTVAEAQAKMKEKGTAKNGGGPTPPTEAKEAPRKAPETSGWD